MLVKNMTKTPLKMRSLKGTKIVLPPLKVINIDAVEFPAERIKKLFGKYVFILTDKVAEDEANVPAKAKEDLEPKESDSVVQPVETTPAVEEENEAAGVQADNTDTACEDSNNDNGDADKPADTVVEELKAEVGGEEGEPVEEGKEEPADSADEEPVVEDNAEEATEKPKRGRKKKEEQE